MAIPFSIFWGTAMLFSTGYTVFFHPNIPRRPGHVFSDLQQCWEQDHLWKSPHAWGLLDWPAAISTWRTTKGQFCGLCPFFTAYTHIPSGCFLTLQETPPFPHEKWDSGFCPHLYRLKSSICVSHVVMGFPSAQIFNDSKAEKGIFHHCEWKEMVISDSSSV